MTKIILSILLLTISNSLFAQKNFTYLALGDSYTIGEGVEADKRFPVQLTKRMKIAEFEVEDPLIIAKTGWTTGELLTAIKIKNVHKKFDMVTLLIGVNNQYRGQDIDTYRKEFKELLEIAIDYAKDPKRVIVVSIPDWGVTPFALQRGVDQEKVRQEIDQFNSVNKEEASNYETHYVNITDISRKIDTRPGLLAPDGLHPSKKMYSLWVDRIFRIAKKIYINDQTLQEID